MAKKVAVLVVHGIGWHDTGKKRGLIDKALTRLMDPPRSVELLTEALGEAKIDPSSYVMKLAHWGKAIEPVQEKFEERYRGLRWDMARRVAISALGDAAQYSAAIYESGGTTFPTHDNIHDVVAKSLAELADECGGDAPLVAIGHSLGGHILSNHVYDEQKARRKNEGPCHGGDRPLERMQTLRAFVTLGCNIPLFVMGAKAPTPIDLAGATWLNYYDPDDVLGFPLEPLYFPDGKPGGYDLRDERVEVGPIPFGWTPISHAGYWDHDGVVSGIARQIQAAQG